MTTIFLNSYSKIKKHICYYAVPVLLIVIIIFGLNSCELDDNEAREKFIGKWLVTETSDYYDGSVMTFDVIINATSEDPDEVVISNFYNMNVDAFAFINGNSIIIPKQLICDDTIEVSGSGNYLSSGKINLSYSTNDGAVLDNLTAVLEKK